MIYCPADVLKVIFKIKCPKERYKGIILGTNGAIIKKITDSTATALNSLLKRPVDISINLEHDEQMEKPNK